MMLQKREPCRVIRERELRKRVLGRLRGFGICYQLIVTFVFRILWGVPSLLSQALKNAVLRRLAGAQS